MSVTRYKNIFVRGPLSPTFIADKIQAHQDKHEIGGHSIFLGQVRADDIENKKVTAIEYTSYEELAIDKMHHVREEIFNKYDLTCMHVFHSLGKVNAGQICFFVFTSSPHRNAAIKACEELVERVKKELPIWGKELFEDDTYQWKENN
jgi:molybdopterin synthase catalytic subunit